MKCPVCGGESQEGTPLCPGCGTALDLTSYDMDPELGKATLVLAREGDLGPEKSEREPPAPERSRAPEIAARCLLSSVLSDPVRLEDGSFYRIGRDKTSDICFPSTHVSRLHAEITFEKGSWVIGDLGSRNGTFVNGERIFKRPLRDGDRIGIGQFEIIYRELSQDELAKLREKKSGRMSDTLKLTQDAIGFFGDVRKLSVVEVVQLLGQNRKTGVLTIHEEKGAPERRLHFLNGEVVHAEFGSLEGERAVQPILRTRAGKFAFRPADDAGDKVTVETPTSTLLLQAVDAMKSL